MEPKKTDKTVTAKVKAASGKMTPFNEGESIHGKFMRVKESTINDRITGERKTIRIYKILLVDGSTASISSRTLLDDAFDDQCALRGGWEAIIGKEITFSRGSDIITEDDETNEVKHMGTYTVTVH